MTSLKFYLDENVANDVATGLRTRGINVLTTAEAGNKGIPDTEQLAFALSEIRVIVTHDRDFLRLSNQGMSHAGMAYCAKQSRTVKQMLQRLLAIYQAITAEEMMNYIEFI